MTALKQEMVQYIEDMPEAEFETLRPALLRLLAPSSDRLIYETDLTNEELAIHDKRFAEWKANPASFTALENL